MKNILIHEFDPEIYPYKLWVIVSKTPDIIADKFDEYNGKHIEFIDADTNMMDAFAMPVRKKEDPKFGVILFFRSKKSMTYELVAHECSHAAKYLFDHINANIEEHEPFEYVIGWMAKCCEKVIKGKE